MTVSPSSATSRRRVRRPWRLGVVLVVLLATAALAAAAARPQAAAAAASLNAYRGLGTWVDMYDSKAFKSPAKAVANMASHGVRTLFLETSNYHWPSDLNQPDAVGKLIQECHARGIKVVAWYLPGFQRPSFDYRRSMAAIDYRTADGQKFDSFGLDIEATMVKPATLRTKRLLALSNKIRAAVGPKYPLGAIIMSPVGVKRYPSIWPSFPYATLASIYDVFVPMGYYTYHGDGYANAYNDTRNNIEIIRQETGLPTVPVNVIGGDAAKSSASETTAYVRALREEGALGGALYDWASTSAASWDILTAVRANPRQRVALPATLPLATPLGNCPGAHANPKEVFYRVAKQKGDRVLHFRLYDAQADEIHLLVNWNDVGALEAGPAKAWTGDRTVTIPASALDPKRANVIGFVADGAFPTWNVWGVRDVSLVAP